MLAAAVSALKNAGAAAASCVSGDAWRVTRDIGAVIDDANRVIDEAKDVIEDAKRFIDVGASHIDEASVYIDVLGRVIDDASFYIDDARTIIVIVPLCLRVSVMNPHVRTGGSPQRHRDTEWGSTR